MTILPHFVAQKSDFSRFYAVFHPFLLTKVLSKVLKVNLQVNTQLKHLVLFLYSMHFQVNTQVNTQHHFCDLNTLFKQLLKLVIKWGDLKAL